MLFSLNLVLLGAASVANALISTSQLTRRIDDLVHKTEDLIKPASQLSISNAPQLILGSGPFFASHTTVVHGTFLIEVGGHYWPEGRDPYDNRYRRIALWRCQGNIRRQGW